MKQWRRATPSDDDVRYWEMGEIFLPLFTALDLDGPLGTAYPVVC